MDVSYYSKSLSAELTDLAAVSADEGWAIGTSQNDDGGGGPEQVLLHRVGDKWQQAGLPAGAEKTSLTQVEASGPGNVWLFGQESGDDGKPLAFRWDGEQWRPVDAPPAGNSWSKRSAAVLAADDVWVLGGERAAHHWNGQEWTWSQLPAGADAVGGTGPDDVWAVGFRDTSDDGGGPMSQPAAMHWVGTEWKSTKTPAYHFPDPAPPEETASLESVVAVSEDEVRAVGNHTFNHGEGGPEPEEENILRRWDGGKWKEAPAKAAEKASM